MSNAVSELLKLAVIGLDEAGLDVALAVLGDQSMTLSGLVDLDPTKTGKRLADLGVASDDSTTVLHDVDQLGAADVAIVCGVSHLDRAAPTLRQLMRKGIPVVSSCEEMTWPWYRHPHLADVLASEARKAGIPIIGAGVRPGFGFDLRPIALAAATNGLRRVVVRRVIDLAHASPALVRRAGLGKSVHQFTGLAKQKLVGQVGLGEYVVLIAQSLGRHPTSGQIGMTVLPLPADAAIASPAGPIEVGQVAGIRQRAVYQDDSVDIEVRLTLTLRPDTAGDDIQIDADPPVQHIRAGSRSAPEDRPAAVLLGVAGQIRALPPGLHTVLDLPPTKTYQQEPA